MERGEEYDRPSDSCQNNPVKKGSRENLLFLERIFFEISFTIDREKGRKNFPTGKVNRKSRILNQQGVETNCFSIPRTVLLISR